MVPVGRLTSKKVPPAEPPSALARVRTPELSTTPKAKHKASSARCPPFCFSRGMFKRSFSNAFPSLFAVLAALREFLVLFPVRLPLCRATAPRLFVISPLRVFNPCFVFRPDVLARACWRKLRARPVSRVVRTAWNDELEVEPREFIGAQVYLRGVHELAVCEVL